MIGGKFSRFSTYSLTFGFFDSFSDLGVQWGFAVALAGGLCDLIVAGFYACMSCCGLC